MTARRRAGAPRLIEWTGERCVPWAPDVQVVYEHLHRYLWAARIVSGRRVLDLGSGEGFGSGILAERAASVIGVDIDARTVEHSRLNYAGDGGNLEFKVASATDLSQFADASFDAVVAFEIIEHLVEHDRMLDEITRVLSPNGVLILSTPDRQMYSTIGGYENPFHERELTLEELSTLLQPRFAHTALWSQRTITGSELTAIDRDSSAGEAGALPPFFVERLGDVWTTASAPVPQYLVAVASNQQLPELGSASTLADCGRELLREAERAAATVKAANADLQSQVAAASAATAAAGHRLRDLQLIHSVDLGRMQAMIDAERRHADAMRTQLLAKGDELADVSAALLAELDTARDRLRRVEESVTWRAFQGLRFRLYGALGGERSVPSRVLSAALRSLGVVLSRSAERTAGDVPAPAAAADGLPEPLALAPIELPVFDEPNVSLIIPLHRGASMTRACLESIRDNTAGVSYEVILVDDDADPETKELLGVVTGATIVANDENIGYLRTVNRGATRSRGRWLVLCNNDIEVQVGWLSAMLGCAESAPDIGAVTPKYLYPDGRLNEAGGIIWRDATGGNYGRGDDPRKAPYNYRRAVDYGSAAALLVRADLFSALGGYDELFVPMYYEDVDLCFKMRQSGMRVMYEPTAVVTHLEGGTAGNDPLMGHKLHQERNRTKFAAKWADTLRAEHLPPRPDGYRPAADRLAAGHVLMIDHQIPTPDRDAGSVRMYGMIGSLQRLGFQVTFMPDSGAAMQPYTRRLEELGVEVLAEQPDLRAQLIAALPLFKAVFLSRPVVAPRWLTMVREFAPTATVVYDTVDLHWVREARAIARNGRGRATAVKVSALRELELAMVRAADATLVATDVERGTLELEVPGARIHVVPMLHDIAATVAPVAGRGGIVFVGNFSHPPNADAAIQLVETIMPEVWRRLPDVPVTIVGPEPPQEVLSLRQPLVDVAGWIEDLDSVLNAARVMVAPLRFGAGMKGKVTQSLSLGLPVVTTTNGAEGLDTGSDDGLLVADDPVELAEKVVELCTDDVLWQRLSRGGQAAVERTCSRAAVDDVFQLLLGQAAGVPVSSVAPVGRG